MHELSLCEHVLDVMEQHAQEQQFRQVKAVYLEIGLLSGVDADAMRFCFESVVRNTLADGATLWIDQPAGQAWCERCRQQVTIAQRYDACPECGCFPLQIQAGEQMRIKQLEVI